MSPTATTEASTLRPTPGRETALPEWAWTTDRNALPDVLDWSGEQACPPIGGRVDTLSYDVPLGTGTVTHYFHAEGSLRLVVALDSVPAWLNLAPGVDQVHLHGDQIIRLDQGEDESELPSLTLPEGTVVTETPDEGDDQDEPAVLPAPASEEAGGPTGEATDGEDFEPSHEEFTV